MTSVFMGLVVKCLYMYVLTRQEKSESMIWETFFVWPTKNAVIPHLDGMDILGTKRGYEDDFFKTVCAGFTGMTLYLSKAWCLNWVRIRVYLAIFSAIHKHCENKQVTS